jgi:RNA polymerase sigma-70 factor (ECF subfamily)
VDELTELAHAAAAGDRLALAAFVRATQADVWRLCRHLAGAQAADDLAQDVYVRAIESLPRFRGEHGVRPWLLAIARHTAIDQVRKDQRRRRLAPRFSARPGLEDDTGRAEIETVDLLAHLDPDRREAFVLTQLVGLTYAEAADVAGVAVGTIRSRVARARAELLAMVERAERAERLP